MAADYEAGGEWAEARRTVLYDTREARIAHQDCGLQSKPRASGLALPRKCSTIPLASGPHFEGSGSVDDISVVVHPG